MDKLAAVATATGVGSTGAAGTYAAYHFGVFGGKGKEQTMTANTDQVSTPQSTSVPVGITASEFKQHNGKCFEPEESVSGGVFDKWAEKGEIKDANPVDAVTNDDVKLDEQDTAKGCLEYRWQLGTGDDKWEGSNFRFVWALSKGNKGFSVFLSATGKAPKTLEFEGVAYFFEKDDKGWKTTKKLEMRSDKKKLTGGQIKDTFPKRNRDVMGTSINQYWNFLDDEGDNIKGGSNEESQIFKFTSSKDGPRSANEWSGNQYDWFSNLFDDKKWNLVHLVKDIKGNWSK